MSTAVMLRLAGPLQSWGTDRMDQRYRPTALHPTRTALLGLIGCCLGLPRGGSLDEAIGGDAEQITVALRTDRPGRIMEDYHTIGGNYPDDQSVATAGNAAIGKARGRTNSTIETRRLYLADAVFIAAIGHPDDHVVHRIAAGFRQPHWAPYLGRRSCPPTWPFYLATSTTPDTDLADAIPIAARRFVSLQHLTRYEQDLDRYITNRSRP